MIAAAKRQGRSLGDNVESADAGHVFGVCVGGKVEDVRVKSGRAKRVKRHLRKKGTKRRKIRGRR